MPNFALKGAKCLIQIEKNAKSPTIYKKDKI